MAAVAPDIVLLDGCWTWFNGPRAVYDAARDTLYLAALDRLGTPIVGSWSHADRLHRAGRPRASVLQVDDHDNPALCLLDDGRVLSCCSQHNGDSFSNRTGTDGNIRSWGSEVTVNTAENDAYAHVFQVGDDAGTVYWFFRRNTASHHFRTSTDGGSTWGGETEFIANSGQRPYVVARQDGASRVDFLVTDGHPGETTNSVYHFYMTVASDGTRSYFKSDGTPIGGDADLPLTPSADMTKVWDGATRNSWIWDLAIVGGSPVAALATYTTTSTTGDTHHYHQARWTGSAWAVEEVCEGGAAATTPHSLSGETYYSGGIGLDPADADSVYVSRKYGAGDWRVEKWTHSGTFGSGSWSKAADVSGSTGTVNARPWCPPGMAATTVLWWEGTYSSYTSYATRVRMSPAPDWRSAKEASPAWEAGEAPPGVQAYYLLHEGSGAPTDLSPNGHDGVTTGTGGTWGTPDSGDHGNWLGSFSASNHVRVDSLATALDLINGSTYPQWSALLFKHAASGSEGYALGFGRSTSNQPLGGLSYTGSDGSANAIARDDAGTNGSITGAFSGSNDSNYHVLMSVRESATRLVRYLDGIAVGSNSSTQGATTFNRGALGTLVRASASNAFGGELHAVAVGWGAAPEPQALALDLVNGQFAGTFALAGGGAASGSLSATLGDVALAGSAAASAPPGSSGSLAATLGPATLAGAATATAPASASGALSATLGDVALAGSGSASAPGDSSGSLAATLDALSLSATAAATAPADADGSLVVTLSGATLSGSASAAEPGTVGGTLAITLGDVTLAGAGESVAPDGSDATLAATLDALALAGSATHAEPGDATATLALTLGDVALAGVASTSGELPVPTTGLFAHYRADAGVFTDTAGTTPATGGQAVARWEDQSGNGRHLTQPTSGSRPVLLSSGLNGKPLVDFDATDDWLASADAGWRSLNRYSIVAVLIPDLSSGADTAFGTILSISDVTLAPAARGPNVWVGGETSTLTGESFSFGLQSTANPGGTTRRLGPASAAFPFTGGVPLRFTAQSGPAGTLLHHGSTSAALTLAGGSSPPSAASNMAPQGLPPVGSVLTLGLTRLDNATSVFPAKYKLAEILIYDAEFDSGGRQEAWDYVDSRWVPDAVTASLAVTLAGATLSGSATADEPADSAGSLAAALDALTLSATATATAAGVVSGSLAATLGDVTLAATATHVGPAGSDGSLSVALDAVTLAGSAAAVAPGDSSGSLAATLDPWTLEATATAATGPVSLGVLAVTLDDATLAADAETTTPPGASATLSATLEGVTLEATGAFNLVVYTIFGGSIFDDEIIRPEE